MGLAVGQVFVGRSTCRMEAEVDGRGVVVLGGASVKAALFVMRVVSAAFCQASLVETGQASSGTRRRSTGLVACSGVRFDYLSRP